MSVRGSSCALGVVLLLAAHALAQPAPEAKRTLPGAAPASPPQSAEGRYAIHLQAETVNVHSAPDAKSQVIVKLDKGVALEADQRRGDWYRVLLPDGTPGWINDVVGKTGPEFSVAASTGVIRQRPAGEAGATP